MSLEIDVKKVTTVQVADGWHDDALFRKLGVFTPAMLREAERRSARRRFLVNDLFYERSVNILVGDSGLGKTPCGLQLGISVAAGVSFLERPVSKGRVLYCDAESPRQEFMEMQTVISHALGLQDTPEDFLAWSPNWEDAHPAERFAPAVGEQLIERVQKIRQGLVIVDPLRAFWPGVEAKNELAAELIQQLRKLSRAVGCTWLVLHHPRKTNRIVEPPSLESEPGRWLEEAAGARALINHADTRLGVVEHATGRADLLLGGLMRSVGPMAPLRLGREYDAEEGHPTHYQLIAGPDLLSPTDLVVYKNLPPRFHFKNVFHAQGGASGSNAARFLNRAEAAGAARKEGREYVKVEPQDTR